MQKTPDFTLEEVKAYLHSEAHYIEAVGHFKNAILDHIERLEAERDATVNDLETVCNMMNICSMCKDHAEGSERCEGCEMSSNWEWRGVQKEE